MRRRNVTAVLVSYYVVGSVAVFVIGVTAYVISRRVGIVTFPRRILIGAIAIVPPLLLLQQLLKYASLRMYADVSHWAQILDRIVTTGLPLAPSVALEHPGTLNYLSVHFVPLIYLFAIPFKFFPHPQTLLVLNIAIMSSAAIPLYLLARHRTGDRRVALLMAALFLWYPTFQYTTLYEFEMIRFSIPILLWMCYAWERQRIGWYYALVILATLVREEVGLTVGMFGVYLFLIERRRWHGVATAVMGFGAFAVMTGFLMPAMREGASAPLALESFSQFGRTPLAIVRGVMSHPFAAIGAMLHPAKLANLAMLFLPLSFLPLLAPAVLLPVLPTFAIGLLSAGGSFVHSSYMLYYVAPSVPFVFIAFIRAWPIACRWVERRSVMRYGEVVRANVVSAMVIGVCSALVVANIAFGPSPIALQFWNDRFRPAPFRTQDFHWSAYVVNDHHRAVGELIARIPNDAIVSAQEFLHARLFAKRGAMKYPQLVSRGGRIAAEYVLLDLTNNGLDPSSPAYASDEEFQIVRADSVTWERMVERNGYEIYRRR